MRRYLEHMDDAEIGYRIRELVAMKRKKGFERKLEAHAPGAAVIVRARAVQGRSLRDLNEAQNFNPVLPKP